MEEYSVATVARTNLKPIMQRATTWYTPPRSLFKINVDGAKATKKASVGVIVRDELGRVEATMCRNLNAPLGAIKTESKAIDSHKISVFGTLWWKVTL